MPERKMPMWLQRCNVATNADVVATLQRLQSNSKYVQSKQHNRCKQNSKIGANKTAK
jgi:hypothetical protein